MLRRNFCRPTLRVPVATIAALGAAMLGPSSASAFSNAWVLDPVALDLRAATTVQIGPFAACAASYLDSRVVYDAGPGQGGTIEPTDMGFSGCTSSGTPIQVRGDVAWTQLDLYDDGTAIMDDLAIELTLVGISCTYAGQVTGTYDEPTGVLALHGALVKQAGGAWCASSSAFAAEYDVTTYGTTLLL